MGVRLAQPTPLGELRARLGGATSDLAARRVVTGIAPVLTADEGDLAPLVSRRKSYVAAARATPAVVLLRPAEAELVPEDRRWVHARPDFVLASLLGELAPAPPPDARALAHIDPRAEVHATAIVGPGAVILAGATIGPGVRVEPNAVVYGGVAIHARATIGAGAVIGRPGFGWIFNESGDARRVPQLGGVILEDDVEVGPLATVDAGTLGPTVIERGAKIDAHVHVGHNARIGARSIIAAQAGFAGSVDIGERSLVGGQAGVSDHVTVGEGARLAAKAGVIGDVPAGAIVAGYPAVARADWLRATAHALRESRRPRRGGGTSR